MWTSHFKGSLIWSSRFKRPDKKHGMLCWLNSLIRSHAPRAKYIPKNKKWYSDPPLKGEIYSWKADSQTYWEWMKRHTDGCRCIDPTDTKCDPQKNCTQTNPESAPRSSQKSDTPTILWEKNPSPQKIGYCILPLRGKNLKLCHIKIRYTNLRLTEKYATKYHIP